MPGFGNLVPGSAPPGLMKMVLGAMASKFEKLASPLRVEKLFRGPQPSTFRNLLLGAAAPRLRKSSSRNYAPLARPPPLRVCIFVCVSFGHVIHTKIVSNIVCKFHTLIVGEKKEILLPLFIITFLIDVFVLTIDK